MVVVFVLFVWFFFCPFVILDGNRTFKPWPRTSIKKPTKSLTEYRSVPCSTETEYRSRGVASSAVIATFIFTVIYPGSIS